MACPNARACHHVIDLVALERPERGEQLKDRIGYLAWIVGAAQFFVIHGIVESAWAKPYSWARNNISDLGNVHCAMQAEPEPRYVCSPAHEMMNASFVVLGILLVVGAVLGHTWSRGITGTVSRLLIASAGAGFVLVGLAPADVDENQHFIGALLVMGVGNLGLLVAGFALARWIRGPLRRLTSPLGITAIAAFALFLSHHYLGLGMGGMERVAAFPLLVWTLLIATHGLSHLTRHGALHPGRHLSE